MDSVLALRSRRIGALYFATALLLGLLAPSPGRAAFPGTNGRITFTRCDTSCRLWSMDADGSNAAPLSPVGEDDMDAAYSADGRKVAFERQSTGAAGIALAAPDLSGATDLTTGSATDPVTWDTGPSFAPDAKTIAFSRSSTATVTDTIWAISSSGGQPTQLTFHDQGLNFDGDPVFSPDGKQIAFDYGKFGAMGILSEIDLMNADGSGRVAFTPPAATAPAPGSNPPAIVTLSSDSPDFSPDGTKLVFAQCCDANQNSRIVVAPVTDGSAVTVITSPDAGHTDGSPAFSPDGTRVVFVRSDVATGESVIGSVPADGGQVDTLSSPGFSDWGPAWQPAPAADAVEPPVTDPPPGPPQPPVTTPNRTPVAVVARVPQLRTTKVAVKRGAASLLLACPANSPRLCTGTLTLQARLKRHGALQTIGTAGFGIQPGAATTVKVRLSRAAKALLGGHRTLSATAKLQLLGGGGSLTTLKLTG